MFWAIPAALAAGGAIKGVIDKGNQETQRRNDLLLEAEKHRYSPWAQATPTEITKVTADPFNMAAQGAQMGILGVSGLQDAGVIAKPLSEQDKLMKFLREREEVPVSGYTQPAAYSPWAQA